MMAKTAAVQLCCILSMLCAVVGVMSITNCDGLICPEGSSCQVSTTSVNGHQQTVKTCTDSEGNVKARSVTSGDHSSRSNSVQSSSFVTSGGGRGCTQQTSSVNGKTTTTYSCSNPEDIQKVKQIEEEMHRRMAEVQQRMAGMMTEVNQGIQNRVMENMQIMRQNLG